MILYMGHKHTYAVLDYLKRLANDNHDSSLVSYTTPSFQSLDTPQGNPVQCLRIPVMNSVISMDEDIYNTVKHEEPSWKYYGRHSQSLHRHKRKHPRKKGTCRKSK